MGASPWNRCCPSEHSPASRGSQQFRTDWLGHFRVAVFAVGLVLAAHPVRFSPSVLVGSLAGVTVQSAVLFALLRLLHVVSPFAREALGVLQLSPGYRGRTICSPVQSSRIRSRFYASRLDTCFGNHRADDTLVEPLI